MDMQSYPYLSQDKPSKIYNGKKRVAYKYIVKSYIPILKWALTVNVGDYIATCEGCNRKVASIKYEFTNIGKQRVLNEVVFEDTNGGIHYCPGGGCAYPKETRDQVVAYQDHLLADTELCKGWGFVKHEVDEYGEYK